MKNLALICSEFNKDLVEELLSSARGEFLEYKHADQWKMEPFWVPGAGEIPMMADWLLKSGKAQAVLALGVIIRGKTGHYDFLCRFLQKALWDLQKSYSLPLVFSVLMLNKRSQAEKRIKRGAEGMKSLIQMIELSSSIE